MIVKHTLPHAAGALLLLTIGAVALQACTASVEAPEALGEADQAGIPGQSKCVAPPGGLVDWWTFDEAAGPTSTDRAGGTNNVGSWIGAPTPIVGKVGNGLRFGSNVVKDGVSVPAGPEVDFQGSGNSAEDFTIDVWVRANAADSMFAIRSLVDKRTLASYATGVVGYSLYLSAGKLGFQMADGSAPGATCGTGPGYPCTNWGTSAFVADGNWHFVAVTVDRLPSPNPLGTVYVDGVAVLTFTPRTGSMVNPAPLRIGIDYTFLSPFKGDLDELEIFKTALPASTILDLYNAGSAGKCKTTCGNNVCEVSEDCCNCAEDCGGGISCC